MKQISFIFLAFLFWVPCWAQIIYGANNYTEYHKGSLPVVISVPHGGYLTPTSIPDRTCNSAVTVTDANTIELAQQIDSAFWIATGCHPAIIYCNLHRAKLDCNRNLSDGACGNAIAENAWHEFNDFIDSAQAAAKNAWGGKAFYIDLHGHGNPIQRLELGYLLYDNELDFTDSVLNTPQYIGYSTIQNLVATNINGYKHAQLLRGTYALGTLFGNAGYPSVPSAQIPAPGTTTNYYSGGYNAANHTSYALNNTVNGLQIECNYTNVRDNYLNRKIFADSLVAVLKNYLSIHQNIHFATCNPAAIHSVPTETAVHIYPNPATNIIEIEGISTSGYFEVEIINLVGTTLMKASNQTQLLIDAFPKGMYLLKLTEANHKVSIFKFNIQ